MTNIRVLIVDDHAVVRQGLTAILSPRNGMEVIGKATNGRDAIRLARELNPDVIIMDLIMPDLNGVEATSAIKQQNQDACILVLTSFQEQDRAAAVMDAGAAGYILKDAGVDELLQAIRSVHSGHMILTPSVVQAITKSATTKPADKNHSMLDLTPRELEVLQGIVDGLTNQAIAVHLDISYTTVRSHVSSILAKLDVSNRTQAALVAQERQLLSKNS